MITRQPLRLHMRIFYLFVFIVSVCSGLDSPPTFAIKDGGEIIYAKSYERVDLPTGDKGLLVMAPNREVAFCSETRPVDAKDGFYYRGFFLFVIDGTHKAAKISSSTGSRFSIVESFWIGSSRLGVLLHLNPSVQELHVYDPGTGQETDLYQGSHFSMEEKSGRPVYVGLCPPRAPATIKQTLFYGSTVIATMDQGDRVLSNLHLSPPAKGSIKVSVIIQDEKDHVVLASTVFQPGKPIEGVLRKMHPPEKRNKNLPVWFLRHDKTGELYSD